MLAIMAFNIAFNTFELSILYIVLSVVINTVAVIAVDGIFATIIRRCLPAKWFDYNVKWAKASKREIRFYEAIGIKKWKDKVLELGCFTSFSKSEIKDPNNPEYIKRFILENNYGAVIHLVLVFVGFLILLIQPKYFYMFGLPVAIVNMFLNFLPLFILRYNTPRLQTLLKYTLRKSMREQENKEIVE